MGAALANGVAGNCCAAIPWMPGKFSLAGIHMMANSAYGMQYSSYIAGVNNVVSAAHRGMGNGVCVTGESVGKGLGPMLAAIGFANSIQRWGKSGHSIIFLCMTALHLVLICLTLTLPPLVENDVVTTSTQAERRQNASSTYPKRLSIVDLSSVRSSLDLSPG